jgi:hypothetical protein
MAMRDEALFNTNISESKKSHQRWFRSVLLQKFEAGQRDEKYVQDYYELLKKADKFMINATAHQKAVAADRWGMNVGRKDQYGRRYDHVGFFDDKHKHVGKTMKEVLEVEMMERRTDDDDYELLGIINNHPIESGLSKIEDVVDTKYNVTDMLNKSKTFEFPIKAVRENDVPNKIEQLAEYMHIKKVGFEHRQLEFFVPLKFKTTEISEDSPIFKQIVNFDYIYVKDIYGEMVGFNIQEFKKRIIHDETHEVWKFYAVEMETIKQY